MSLRKLRVMLENLPPDNPLARAREGEWAGDVHAALLYQIESRLRELVTDYRNVHREANSAALEVKYLPRPLSPEEEAERAAQKAYDDLMQQQLEQLGR